MPVRFRGLSEYKRSFRWRKAAACGPSQQQQQQQEEQEASWAGLRSDQLGISREPKFISKRRVPYRNPQISKSFEWTADCDLNDPLETEALRTAELHRDHNNNDMNQEKIEMPEGPGLPPKVRSHSADSRVETTLALPENNVKRSPPAAPPNQNEAFVSPKNELLKVDNGLHRVLQRKASMNISPLHTFPRNSEYQSQFVWKSPHEKSPILAAEQVKELRARAKAYRQRIEGTHFSRYHLNQILSDNNSLWDVSSSSSSEEGISNNIRALDLARVSEKETSPSPKALHQPASREELHQDSTEKKGLSDASTVPVKRRLVWGEQEGTEKRDNQPSTEEEEKENEQVAVVTQELNDKDATEDKKIEGENALVLNSSVASSDSSSVSSRTGGRLPTPKLRALGGAQRTHHDLTTPAVGGAVLVSPPKSKSSSPQRRTRGLGTDPSPAKQGAREASKRRSCWPDVEVEAASLLTSPPAGLGTLDPLPLRQDQWPGNSVYDERVSLASEHQEHSSPPHMLKAAEDRSTPYWSPSRRIQGTLKDPEFQHNRNVLSPKTRSFQFPLQERNYNNEDDRLSQISARSAASSSLASQVLERAQKRKEDFWGKT
ncbi:nuclear protein MDM1 isoform X6 [Apteryx rowi]|uniref:nuclear protein MDM1 isoform X6 n=1 Tax=Apteryx rowi TaxID=308060 RepID=UPI000E1CC975|nr:nuclear protein MDM1 isoform X6 [Apteryx rowi]